MSLCRGVDGGRWDRCSFGKPRRAEAKRFRENTPTTPIYAFLGLLCGCLEPCSVSLLLKCFFITVIERARVKAQKSNKQVVNM